MWLGIYGVITTPLKCVKEHMYGVRFYMVSTTTPLKCMKERIGIYVVGYLWYHHNSSQVYEGNICMELGFIWYQQQHL